MTTRRNFRSRRRGSGTRPKLTWENFALTFTLGTAGVLVFVDLTPVPLRLSVSEDRHGTAVLQRTIMSFSAVQISNVVTVSQQYAIGMYVQTLQAIANLEILEPLGNLGQDWAYWTARSTLRETDADPGGSREWDVDLRMKRRLRSGYGLVLVMEPLVANTGIIVVTASVRLLWAISN